MGTNGDSRPGPLKVILSSEHDPKLLLGRTRKLACFAPHFFSQELFPTRALEVSNQGETNLVIWGGKILPRPIIQKSMVGASKAIRFPKLEAYKKLLEAHNNACSFVPKLGEVKILINSFSVDMLCITETWLNSDVMDAEASIENYNIVR